MQKGTFFHQPNLEANLQIILEETWENQSRPQK